jgi:metal-sulfur cluster biosynthetic enzyme
MISEEQVINALRDIEDPEFPTSIVDLGLICGVEIEGSRVKVRVTFTSMGCPAMDWIQEDINLASQRSKRKSAGNWSGRRSASVRKAATICSPSASWFR